MLEQALLQKIIDCQLSLDELTNFALPKQMANKLNNSFNQYFDAARIKNAIDLYLNKKIDKQYLSQWAAVYNRIIMASFRAGQNGHYPLAAAEIVEVVNYALNDLSAFMVTQKDITVHETYLASVIKSMQVFETVYHNPDGWQIFYTENSRYVDPDDEILLMFVNQRNQTYFEAEGLINDQNDQLECEGEYLRKPAFILKEEALLEAGYQALI